MTLFSNVDMVSPATEWVVYVLCKVNYVGGLTTKQRSMLLSWRLYADMLVVSHVLH